MSSRITLTKSCHVRKARDRFSVWVEATKTYTVFRPTIALCPSCIGNRGPDAKGFNKT